MKYIFVDFEMTKISKKNYPEEFAKCFQEIIEIGAVMLDEKFEEVSSFKRYVKPDYSTKISNKLYDLTGISEELLSGMDGFEIAINLFAKWCLSLDSEIKVYAWSDSDLNQIINESDLKKINLTDELCKVLDNWIDLQKIYDNEIGSSQATSLTHALESVGIYFEGHMHDALDDARNTGRLYVELSDPEEFHKSLEYIKNAINGSKQGGTTLGDLLDFSKFILSA